VPKPEGRAFLNGRVLFVNKEVVSSNEDLLGQLPLLTMDADLE
jgi:hypothetical protein